MHIKSIVQILEDETGATAIEYGLIAGLVAVAAIASLSALGEALDGVFTRAAGELKAAVGGGGAGGGGGT